jgi:hypothetical protein
VDLRRQSTRGIWREESRKFSASWVPMFLGDLKEPNYLNVVNNFRNILFAKNGNF